MTSKFCFALSTLTALTALTLGSAAHAQSQGSWLVRGGFTQLAPQVSSGTLRAPSLPGAQSGVGNSTQLSGGITYMVDVTQMPVGAFGYVPTPALVAPIEFTMRREDYAALGGHVGGRLQLCHSCVSLPVGVRRQCGSARATCHAAAPAGSGALSPARRRRTRHRRRRDGVSIPRRAPGQIGRAHV